MELFLDDPNGLPKFAAAFTRLSENPDEWQAEIVNELFRQAPYAGEFTAKVIMNELDPERRYGMGAVELKTRQAVGPQDHSVPEYVQGVNKVLIPVVIKEGKLSPLDVFLSSGKAMPLTEHRLRKAMFRPQLFEAVAKRPGDQDMMNTLFPPYRSGGFGLGGNSRVGTMEQGKTASANIPLVDAIHNTIKEADVKRVEDQLNADPTLQAAILRNEATAGFMAKLARPRKALSDRQLTKIAMGLVRPKVIQVSKSRGGFMIKTAAPDTLAPEENEVTRPDAESIVGKDVVKNVERDGTVTISTDPVVRDSLSDAKIKVVDEFGEYKVRTKDGKELVGWVFPRCVDLGGVNLALAIFSNGSQSGVQENIAASPVGKGTNLIDGEPEGFGCFYLARQGGAVAIVPMDIKGHGVGPDGTDEFQVSTMLGDAARIRKVEGLNKVAEIGDGVYGIPQDCGWLPLRNMTKLADSADEFTKTAQVRGSLDRIEVMYDQSGVYSMRGKPMEKLASAGVRHQYVDQDQTVFNMALLGVHPSTAKEKLAEARKASRWCSIEGVRPVTLASEKYAAAKAEARTFIENMPRIKSLLLKEAAALDDPMSVDKVLSVGFLNPENISTFVSYLPEFEDVLSKLSELLIASRLGLSTVDTGALERVVQHLDKVTGGLRELNQHPQA